MAQTNAFFEGCSSCRPSSGDDVPSLSTSADGWIFAGTRPRTLFEYKSRGLVGVVTLIRREKFHNLNYQVHVSQQNAKKLVICIMY